MNKKTIALIEKSLNISIEKLRQMDIDEERTFIKSITKSNPGFSRKKKGISIGRGNPLLVEGKITTDEDIDARIKKLYSRRTWF